jgi:hypothetical protein
MMKNLFIAAVAIVAVTLIVTASFAQEPKYSLVPPVPVAPMAPPVPATPIGQASLLVETETEIGHTSLRSGTSDDYRDRGRYYAVAKPGDSLSTAVKDLQKVYIPDSLKRAAAQNKFMDKYNEPPVIRVVKEPVPYAVPGPTTYVYLPPPAPAPVAIAPAPAPVVYPAPIGLCPGWVIPLNNGGSVVIRTVWTTTRVTGVDGLTYFFDPSTGRWY